MIEKPHTIQPLASGASNQALLLKGDTEAYVFKWLRQNDRFGLDRQAEFALQQQLAERGLAPDVLALDPERWVLQSYIDAPSLRTLSDNSAMLRYAAQALAKVHQQRPQWRGQPLVDKLDYYLRQPSVSSDQRQQWANYRDYLTNQTSSPVLCHFDLAFEHVLLSKPLTIIDWEYAGWGDRLTDLASTLIINRLNTHDADEFIEHYQQAANYLVDHQALQWQLNFVEWMNTVWLTLLGQGKGNE